MGNKDYYAILGISRWATDDEIKRAYKQKALKHHPDKNRDDVDAEKQFMDISEAYEMLSDSYKRSLYDRFGSDNLGTNSRDSFRSSFSSAFGNNSNHDYTYDSFNNYFIRYKDPTTFYDLYVTLEEVNKGATRKLKVTRKRFKPELNTTEKDEKLLEIQIKPGWKEGTKITFEGEGDEGDQNTIAGDIVFVIRDKPHPIFERSNSDIIYRVKITLKQALLGTLLVIPFLDATKPPYQLRTYQEILTPQTEKRFPNEGLPYPKDPTRRGDMIVRFDVLFPKVLNNEQRTFADSCFSNSMDVYQPFNSVLHTTIIDETKQQQQQQSVPTPPPPVPPKPQSSSSNHHHRKPFHRHVNSNWGHKSSAGTSNNTNQTKAPPARAPPTVPPLSPKKVPINETVF